MKAIFVELPPFDRYRKTYVDDDNYREFQLMLLANPIAGDVIKGTGGLRKVRFKDKRRGKGKRGGIRIIYYWWAEKSQFWLFTIYDKNEMDDLTTKERQVLADLLSCTLKVRSL
ncbi:toxin [Candidatus Endobugula sertula]|uniref:Toxin n=1 Tax=Candidatus Endobugula sertula TaxID=62101 RepID=A0A1D2QPV1_9GAMM|nr:toxin [Candidatus Endobugula sertula]